MRWLLMCFLVGIGGWFVFELAHAIGPGVRLEALGIITVASVVGVSAWLLKPWRKR